MLEKIGKVKVDYSKYSGEDFYCDGAVEDELLEIVKHRPSGEYAKIIEERNSWPLLYHLSPLRENIVDWIPMESAGSVKGSMGLESAVPVRNEASGGRFAGKAVPGGGILGESAPDGQVPAGKSVSAEDAFAGESAPDGQVSAGEAVSGGEASAGESAPGREASGGETVPGGKASAERQAPGEGIPAWEDALSGGVSGKTDSTGEGVSREGIPGEGGVNVKRGAKVLEVGSGCGAITGALARRADQVTCVELSKKRSLINAYRHRELDNVTIRVGNFKDIEPDLPRDYDFIFLIGVFEYAQEYIGGDTPYEDFLKILLPHLAAGGRIVIAIENKYGLKYFAGCKEDHLGTYFSGIENYAEGGKVRTFSRKGLERIFKNCGVGRYHFYYPYPDYKFMTMLYSDDYLPGKGELSNNLRNFDRDRMLLFDEKNAFDGLVEDGLFPVFSNSFLAVIGNGFETKYVKYSNDRAPEYAIRTEIAMGDAGMFDVRKYPMGEAAADHIRGMAAAYESLRERYQGSDLEINRCEIVEDGGSVYARFEFVQGIPLSELMDRCLEKDDVEGFHQYFRQYVERIGYNSEYPAADFDLIFANILVSSAGNYAKGKWTLIDYEWTFGKPIDTKELAFRAVYCYLLENEKRNRCDLDLIMQELSITEQEAEYFREQERDFQSFVTGERAAMAQMRDKIGCRMMVPQKWIDRYQDSERVNRVQIYEDKGAGYREGDSYFVREAYLGDSLIEMELTVNSDVKILRIDPCMCSCVVKICEMTFNGMPVPLDKRKTLYANGRIVKPAGKEEGRYCPSIVFATDDPNVSVALGGLKGLEENKLWVKMEVVRLPMEVAKDLEEKGRLF